jgi:hypothetical protein
MPDPRQIGTVPTKLELEKSLMFFHAYMYGPLQGKLRIYGARKISAGAVATPRDWEVFASMIVNDVGQKLAAGIDLTNYEVKSAKRKAGYEYQYHKFSGREKLIKNAEVGHLFFEYSDDLGEVNLRYMHGSQLAASYFDKWLSKFPEKPEDYQGERWRKQIPFGTVVKNGKLLMRLVDGEVDFPPIEPQNASTNAELDEDLEESAEE